VVRRLARPTRTPTAELLHSDFVTRLAVGMVFCEGPGFVELHGRLPAGLNEAGRREFTRMAAALLLWDAVSDADRLFDRGRNS